jgi:hypothetical protein
MNMAPDRHPTPRDAVADRITRENQADQRIINGAREAIRSSFELLAKMAVLEAQQAGGLQPASAAPVGGQGHDLSRSSAGIPAIRVRCEAYTARPRARNAPP